MDSNRMKFRVWDSRRGRFFYLSAREAFVAEDIPDDHVQQCTGLLDSAGRDVYEGDIVDYDDSSWSSNPVRGLAEVIFVRDLLAVDSPCYGLWFRDGLHRSMRGAFEIKGNIFENAELMTEKQTIDHEGRR
jgi:uncharacterized phage protein (TIGR01671 family)